MGPRLELPETAVRVRTLSQLQNRIIFLQDRLRRMMEDTDASEETKEIVRAFEQRTISNLQSQLRHRIAFYLRCVGC